MFRAMLLACVGVVFFTQPALAAWYWPFGKKTIDYEVKFEGLDEESLAWFESLKLDEPVDVSPDSEDESSSSKSDELLKREALERELVIRGGRIRQALEAIGYYDAAVQQAIQMNEDMPVLVYSIKPGLRYVVGDVDVVWEGGEAVKAIRLENRKTQVGESVDARSILEDAVAILDDVGNDSCLMRLNVEPQVRLYENRMYKGRPRATVVFRIQRGAKADFGETTVSGNTRVKDEVILRSVNWKEGRCFRQTRVDDTRTNLVQSQLFSSVSITYPMQPDADGQVPMHVHVAERDARTLRAGGSFNTEDGVVVTSGWEHRNLWGGAEKLNVGVSVGDERQSLNTSLRLPDFWSDKQVLALTGSVSREDTDAYVATTLEGGASLERPLMRNLRGSLGVGYRLTETEDVLAGNNTYGLLSFPTFLEYDSRNNVLDPKRGIFANLSATPYSETFGDGGRFVKTQFTGQTYVTAPIALSPTLAVKVAAGSIFGAEGNDVPSDLRFYAGGGGSVRGYGYQTLGPRVNGTPVGGSSFLAGSLEGRFRFTDDFGGVIFADAGNAYDQTMPDQNEKFYTSVGTGIRYFTAIGPLRADIAIPLNGKDVGAAGYAVYISIGQSF